MPANSTSEDIGHMRHALRLAARALGQAAPNPAVGCLIVSREGHIVGRGWTQPGGRPHAETEALAQAGALAQGGTAYVTLEPCAHHALRKRPVEAERVERMVTGIVRRLESMGENEIPSNVIGELVMQALSSLDKVAYIRFASVYKNFREAKDFEAFVGELSSVDRD